MTDATLLAPAGTINEFLTNLGIHDESAVHSVNIDAVGLITVVLKVRGPDGKFLTGTYVDSPLPVNVTATLRFAEDESDYEPLADWERELAAAADDENFVPESAGTMINGREIRTIQAYNTEQAINALDATTSGKAHDWHLLDDVGVRGQLRTFTFAHNGV